MTAEPRREGQLSDGEIIARIDALDDKFSGGIAGINGQLQAMDRHYTEHWQRVVFTDVYEADKRTAEAKDAHRQEIARLQGEAITDVQAELTRKDRDRRKMWTAIAVAIISAGAAWLFSLSNPMTDNRPVVNVCVPVTTQNPCPAPQ